MSMIGKEAIDFALEDQDGNLVRLSDYKGQKIVLYFYPKDSTPGCTKQACGFRDSYDVFVGKNVKVIGVSKDSVKSHKNFSLKQELPFTLVSDPNMEAINAYGVYQEKKSFGKVAMGVVRTTFLIDESFVIRDVLVGKTMHAAKNALDVLESEFMGGK